MHTSTLFWIHAHPAVNGETVYIGWFEDRYMCVIRRSRRTYVTVAQLQSDSHSHGELIFSAKPPRPRAERGTS
jgi:hypothetical protein